jgi:hypothetical protein
MLKPGLEGGVVQDRGAASQIDLALEGDPGFAAAIIRRVRQFDEGGELINSHQESEDVRLFAPFEAFAEEVVGPDMLAAELFQDFFRTEIMPLDEPGPMLKTNCAGRWKARCKLIETFLSRRNHRLALLMEKRWKQQELKMFHLKATAPFVNPAFAQNENLLPARERIDHHRPFFECDFQRRNVIDGPSRCKGSRERQGLKRMVDIMMQNEDVLMYANDNLNRRLPLAASQSSVGGSKLFVG